MFSMRSPPASRTSSPNSAATRWPPDSTLEERWLDPLLQGVRRGVRPLDGAGWRRGRDRDRRRTAGRRHRTRHRASCCATRAWGQGFPEPSFDGVFAIKSARIVGSKRSESSSVRAEDGGFDAIAFNYLDDDQRRAAPQGTVHLVYRLDINEYARRATPAIARRSSAECSTDARTACYDSCRFRGDFARMRIKLWKSTL